MSFNTSVADSGISDGYIDALLAGDRAAAKLVIDECIEIGVEPIEILTKLIWPVMEQIQYIYKEDRINKLALNLATRLNRSLADQIGSQLAKLESNGKKIMIACGDGEPEELGAQICADLFESTGWEVRFVGGGVANDEILPMVGGYRPDMLMLFATRPQGVPAVRKLIDYLREVNSNPEMQVMCCGGIYKRAEGLAEEIGADLYAADAIDAVRVASGNPFKKATTDGPTVGRRRSRKATPDQNGGQTVRAA